MRVSLLGRIIMLSVGMSAVDYQCTIVNTTQHETSDNGYGIVSALGAHIIKGRSEQKVGDSV